MFGPISRYHGLPISTFSDARGHTRPWVALRLSEAPRTTVDYTVRADERFDRLGAKAYGDPTLWWHVADANSDELSGVVQELLNQPGRKIELGAPVRPEVSPA